MTYSNEQYIAGLAAQIKERGIDAVVKEMKESLATSVANWIEARKIYANDVMQAMPESYRHRWCNSGPCACMGAANCSGGAGGKISYDEWKEWVAANPEPEEKVKGRIGSQEELKAYLREKFKPKEPESRGQDFIDAARLDYN